MIFLSPRRASTHTQFIVTTYVLAMLWMLVFALSALPVYFLYNMDATCRTIDVLTETPASINQLCVDARQYGTMYTGSPLDWSADTFPWVCWPPFGFCSFGFCQMEDFLSPLGASCISNREASDLPIAFRRSN